jgi:hypothetical protein
MNHLDRLLIAAGLSLSSVLTSCNSLISSTPSPAPSPIIEASTSPEPSTSADSTGDRSPQVPNLEVGMSYDRARQLIIEAGWQPIATTTDNPQDGTASWRERGYNEVVACSGTGMGFCRFEFGAADNRKLVVVTAGRDSTLHHWDEETEAPS